MHGNWYSSICKVVLAVSWVAQCLEVKSED